MRKNMSKEKLILSILSPDRPGVIQEISDTVLAQGGNWLESSLSRLGGQFAGIVRIEFDGDQKAQLIAALNALDRGEISIAVHEQDDTSVAEADRRSVDLIVEANDRPGIIEEISSALADAQINVEHMETSCMSASMAGYQLFVAELVVALPKGSDVDDLESVLEQVSDDLVVSIEPV